MLSRNHYNDRTLSWLLAYTKIFAIVKRMDVSRATRNGIKTELYDIYRHILGLIRTEVKSEDEENKARTLINSCLSRMDIGILICKFYVKKGVFKSKSFVHKLFHSRIK